MLRVPAGERHLLHRGAHRNRRTHRRRIDPDGIGLRPLRRNEAVQNHQAGVVRPVLFGAPVDRRDTRRGGEHRAQQFRLRRVDGHRQRGLRRQFQFGMIVVRESCHAATGGRPACPRRWCDIRTRLPTPRPAPACSGARPGGHAARRPRRSEIERQVHGVRPRAVIARRPRRSPRRPESAPLRRMPTLRRPTFSTLSGIADHAQIARQRGGAGIARRGPSRADEGDFARRGGRPAPARGARTASAWSRFSAVAPGCDAAIASSIFLRSGSNAVAGVASRRRAPA